MLVPARARGLNALSTNLCVAACGKRGVDLLITAVASRQTHTLLIDEYAQTRHSFSPFGVSRDLVRDEEVAQKENILS